MLRYVGLVLKGMAYGITHLVPGLGGGLILITMGIYDEFVDAVGNFVVERHRWPEFLRFLVPVGLGMVASVVLFSGWINWLWTNYQQATKVFFIGLMLGTIPGVVRLHDDMRPSFGRIAGALVGLAVVVAFRAIPQRLGYEEGGALTGWGGALYVLVTSFLGGGASVTPGMDGSYVLILAGTYQPIMAALSALKELHVQWVLLGSLGVGAVAGVLGFSKLIDIAIRRAPSVSYYVVLGLIVGALYGLWPDGLAETSPLMLLAVFAAGLLVALVFGREPESKEPQAV